MFWEAKIQRMLTQDGVSEADAHYLNKETSKRGTRGWGWRMEEKYLQKQRMDGNATMKFSICVLIFKKEWIKMIFELVNIIGYNNNFAWVSTFSFDSKLMDLVVF